MKAIYFNEHGNSSVLNFGEIDKPSPKKDEILLKVKYVALNHLDIWVRRGFRGLNLEFPHVGGSDMVCELLEDLDEKGLKKGDLVSVYSGFSDNKALNINSDEFSVHPSFKVLGEHVGGGLAEFVCAPKDNIISVSSKRSLEQVCATTLVGLTAYRMLFVQENIEAKKSILIVGGGGGVNLISFLIAKALGLETIVLTSKEKEVKNLNPAHVINYKDDDNWHRAVMKLTNGEGVDLVVDNVGEKTFEKSLKALSFGGSLLTVGNTSGYNVSFDNRLIFGKQLKIIGSTMGSFTDFVKSQEFFDKHNIEIPIDTITTLDKGISELIRLEKGEQFGKIVINI